MTGTVAGTMMTGKSMSAGQNLAAVSTRSVFEMKQAET
jgi:hypothetical protein